MLDSAAVLKVATGDFYTAPIGTALPADLSTVTETWEHMGHTSLEDILSSASEGGESQTLPSLQNRSLRQTVSSRTESYTVNLLQFDNESLTLYYGANAEVTLDGHVRPHQSPVPVEKAWLFVFKDGERVGGIYAPKASFYRADDFSIADTESLNRLSLRVTPLVHNNNTYAIEFVPPHVPGAGA